MRAIAHDAYGGPEVLELRDVPKPAYGDKQVLLRVHAAGVDRGVWHLLTGRPLLVRAVAPAERPSRSPVRGMEVAGRVEAVGAAVTGLRAGDEVFGVCDGSFAEYATAGPEKLAPKPANLSFEEAAVVPVSGCTALLGLRDRAGVRPGQRVLITGAGGGVGTFAVQIAKAFGAEVTGVCAAERVELVRSLGADRVIDRTRDDVLPAGERYDAILDLAGLRRITELRRALTERGIAVLVGGEGGGRWLGGFQRQMLYAPALSIVARRKVRPLISKERTADLLALKDLIESGKVRPVIDRSFPLSETADAIRRLESGAVGGKVVVSVAAA